MPPAPRIEGLHLPPRGAWGGGGLAKSYTMKLGVVKFGRMILVLLWWVGLFDQTLPGCKDCEPLHGCGDRHRHWEGGGGRAPHMYYRVGAIMAA